VSRLESAEHSPRLDTLAEAARAMGYRVEVRFVKDFHDHRAYAKAVAKNINDYWFKHGRPDKLLMSFHGIPKASVERGDPYQAQCHESARLVAAELEQRWNARLLAVHALEDDDWIFPSYRESAIGLLRGMPPETVLSWWRGHPAGWWDPREYGVASIAVPIATHVPHAVGFAWGKKLRGEPSLSTDCRRSVVWSPFWTNSASMPPDSSPGNVHETICEKNLLKPLQPTQFSAQRPWASLVHATLRPRPYCHCARTGSSRDETSTVCAAALAVVPL